MGDISRVGLASVALCRTQDDLFLVILASNEPVM